MRVYALVFVFSLAVSPGIVSGSRSILDVKAEPVEVDASAARPAPDKVVVTVNGVKIMQSVVDKKVGEFIKMRMAKLGEHQMPPERMEATRKQMRPIVADYLVEKQLFEEKLKAEKIQVSDEQIKARIEEIARQQNVSVCTWCACQAFTIPGYVADT